MTEVQFELLNQLVIQPLKNQKARVYIFGSRAKQNNHPHSDVDILFQLIDNEELPYGFISKIREDIDESKFPFIVEIVNIKELAKSYAQSILNSMIEV